MCVFVVVFVVVVVFHVHKSHEPTAFFFCV